MRKEELKKKMRNKKMRKELNKKNLDEKSSRAFESWTRRASRRGKANDTGELLENIII